MPSREEILDANRSGDSIRAEETMRGHFLNIRTRVTSIAPEGDN
jgi:DNA-binding GntR family transcriptional regulator